MSQANIHSPLEFAILGLLVRQARSGYDVLKVFAETALGGFSNSPGAVYPALKRLQRDGFVAGDVENRETLRPRQVFTVTAAGAERLKEYLRQPVTRDDVIRRPDEVLLRFAFAGEVLGPEAAGSVLEQYAGQIEAYLPELRAQLAAIPETASPYGRYALQRGIDGYSGDARWARRVIVELRQSPARRPKVRRWGSGRPRGSSRSGGKKS